MKKVLVVGCAPNSLGRALVDVARNHRLYPITAGIQGEEVGMDVVTDDLDVLRGRLYAWRPDAVVCTVGQNVARPATVVDPAEWLRTHYEVNVIGPMRLLEAWVWACQDLPCDPPRHFVAISSNSAHVPRSNSAAYCASKAGLSMGLRVKAREGKAERLVIYGYEPGLLAGTPMTQETCERFPGPLTRMRPEALAAGIATESLARMIATNLNGGAELNGVMFRIDADEA